MLKKILLRGVLIILALYAILVVYRAFVLYGEDKTEAQVAKIHATKLTLDDVMGKNLPPDPSDPDSSIPGFDANMNGIRDDVELAIFKEYPNSAKTRAVLLQYALALQNEATQTSTNTEIVIASVQEEDRAYICVGSIIAKGQIGEADKLRKLVENLQLNTEARKIARRQFYKDLGSYSSLDRICDIDYSALPN